MILDGTEVQHICLKEILEERKRQDSKWNPKRSLPVATWMTILGEEFGEACLEALQGNLEAFRKEMIQVAAVALAILEADTDPDIIITPVKFE